MSKNNKRLFLLSAGTLLFLCCFLLTGCGDSSKPEIPESLTPHASINIDGGTATESNLAITSNNTTESGVSVTNGGTLTLSDSTIYKTAPEGSTVGGGAKPEQAPDPNLAPGALARSSQDANLTFDPSQGTNPDFSPNADRPPDPNLAPSTPGPPGTPGGAPPPGDPPGGTRGGGEASMGSLAGGDPGIEGGGPGGGDIGSRSSGVYAGSEGKATLSNVSIDTNLEEGKGLCAIGNGSSITMTKGTITTAGRSSHGVFATGSGSVSLKDVSIQTKGEHSSVLATDTGGGTIIAEGGTYTALGKYSSGIYSTGDIRVSNATIRSESDNAAVVEWNSKITLNNTSLWSDKKGAVMIYQSSSTTEGMSEYKMAGGSITAEEGPIFYVTNTDTIINLKNVELSAPSGTVLEVLKGDWGSDVANAKPTRGGTVTFNADEQSLPGDIVLDENSSITLTLKNKSKIKGAINSDNLGKEMNLLMDSSSTWEVTDDSYLNSLILSGGISSDSISNIIGNGHTVYYNKSASSSALDGKTYNLAKGGKLQPM